MIKRLFGSAMLVMALSACGTWQKAGDTISSVAGPTPEAQIVNGSNIHKVATVAATALLKINVITVAQAKQYRALLDGPSKTLDDVYADLVKCRKATGTTEKSSPDPCRAGVVDIIRLAVDAISDVRKTLEAKK